ncbi:protein SPT2 homolog [Eublepharis macularius]|uniref:Protein SPT2 homolog n=1 Tax=Eublepharis macularius TaxID=481883 RepID=A0AA97IVR0_EUBMA|nr:protein SPT2 homolog [Eublepharis macularius]
MEFSEILMVATEQQGLSAVPKRYSLAVGPPKKDPKVKGVHSAAVQAFLKRQEADRRKKDLAEKKRKEELLAKRVELKHDRKARAMASRTKDNFCGYNGIPVEEKPKRRQACESRSDRPTEAVECMTGDEMEQFEYSQTESEHESENYEEKPSKASVKPKVSHKSAPPQLNFTDLLKLAEKKQYEPVEIKVVKKTEERPMTAEELREREYLERKNRKGVVLKEKKGEKEMKHVIASGCSKKDQSQKVLINAKLSKHSTDTHSFFKGNVSSQTGSDKKDKGPALSSKPKHNEKAKPALKGPLKSSSSSSHTKAADNGGGKSGLNSHALVLKTAANAVPKQSSVKEPSLKKTFSHVKPTSVTATQHESIKHSNSKQASSSSGTGGSLPRKKSSLSTGPGRPGSNLNTERGLQSTHSGMGPGRSGSSSGSVQPSSSSGVPRRPGSSVGMGPGRPGSSSGPMRSGSGQSTGPGRPSSMLNNELGKGISSGPGPGWPSSTSAGNIKPKCTVVSETISSKNLVPRQSSSQMNGMRPVAQQRPGILQQGFRRPFLPVTSKRPYEDEDDDSEMDDFIDDEGEPQEEISKHIREIFGYDRSKYKDESDYALRYMESSWKEQQKEEAKSLRLGMQEDLEEQRREEEELKRKKQAKKLRTR